MLQEGDHQHQDMSASNGPHSMLVLSADGAWMIDSVVVNNQNDGLLAYREREEKGP